MSYRSIQILGNVGKDPVIRRLDNGSTVANFSVATTDKFRDKAGTTQEKTHWFNVSVWQQGDSGLVSSVIQKYVGKGAQLFINGLPEIQEYEKDGVKQRSFNIRVGGPGSTIRLCGGKSKEGGDSAPANGSGAPGALPDLNDDVPF
jgi:single-strand DNA-binding protein